MRAMQYYDVMRHWRRVRPHLADPIVANVLVFDFNLYTYGRWKEPFEHGMVPHEFESCDWWLSHRGRKAGFLAIRQACRVSLAGELQSRAC